MKGEGHGDGDGDHGDHDGDGTKRSCPVTGRSGLSSSHPTIIKSTSQFSRLVLISRQTYSIAGRYASRGTPVLPWLK